MIIYKKGKDNVVFDASSRRYALFCTPDPKIFGLECLRDMYDRDKDFDQIYRSCVPNGFFFQRYKLCIPRGSMRELLVEEARGGSFKCQFGVQKTLETLKENLFWPYIKRYVEKHYERFITCNRAKSRLLLRGLYTPLPTPSVPQTDMSMNFI